MTRHLLTTAALVAAAVALAAGAEKPVHNHHHVQSIGKANAPAYLANAVEFEGAVGATVSVPLQLVVTQAAEQMQVRISGSDGLKLNPNALEFDFADVKPGALVLPAIDVSIAAAGRHYLTARSAGQVRGGAMGVVVMTPGAKAAAATVNKALATDARGRALRVLPAVETR